MEVTLANGIKSPQVQLGTFRLRGETLKASCKYKRKFLHIFKMSQLYIHFGLVWDLISKLAKILKSGFIVCGP